MENNNEIANKPRRKFSWTIQIITMIYGLLYLAFFVVSFIPSDTGNPVSDNPFFDPWDAEQIWVKLQFLLFLVGFYYSWKSKLISGIIYLVWYAGMVAMGFWVSSALHRDGGDALVLGFPLLVLGIILLISGLMRRKKQ
jgi:hypothetical protein